MTKCEHKHVSVRIVTVERRDYEKINGEYKEVYTKPDDIDWETAYIECDDCRKILDAKDIFP